MTQNQLQGPRGEHSAIEALLPWYANGALESGERRRVAAHLERCDACREELKFLGDVRAVLRVSAATEQPAPVIRNAGFASLPPDLQARVLATPRRTLRKRQWIPALAASLVAAAGLGVALTIAWLDAPRFRTTTSGGEMNPGSLLVAVRFAPQAELGELHRLLREHGAVIVRGSGETETWVLEVPARERDAGEVLPEMRRAPGVVSAELLSPAAE